MVRNKQRQRDAASAPNRELPYAALKRAIKASSASAGKLTNATDPGAALIREDLEPVLYELFKGSFPSYSSFYDDLVIAVGSSQSFIDPEVMADVRETMCIRCRIRPHSDFDLYHCERCRPKST